MIHATLQDSEEWRDLEFTLRMLWNIEGSSYTTGSCVTLCPSYENRLVSKLKFIHYWSGNAGTTAHQKNLLFPLPRIFHILDYSQLKLSESPEESKKLHGRNCCHVTWEEVINPNTVNKCKEVKLSKDELKTVINILVFTSFHANRGVR